MLWNVISWFAYIRANIGLADGTRDPTENPSLCEFSVHKPSLLCVVEMKIALTVVKYLMTNTCCVSLWGIRWISDDLFQKVRLWPKIPNYKPKPIRKFTITWFPYKEIESKHGDSRAVSIQWNVNSKNLGIGKIAYSL